MAQPKAPLPHWTWDDLETALDRMGAAGRAHPVREHLMRGLSAEAQEAPPEELLKTLLCTAVLVSRLGDSGINPLQEDRSFGSC